MTHQQKLCLSDVFVNEGDRVLITGTVVASSITEATTFYSETSKFNPNTLQYGMTLANPVVYSEQLKQQPPNNVPTLKDFIESSYTFNSEHNETRYVIHNTKNETFNNRPIIIDQATMQEVNLLGELASGQEVVIIINVYYSNQFHAYKTSFDGVVIIQKRESRVDINALNDLPTLKARPVQEENRTEQGQRKKRLWLPDETWNL